jgi:hypothetical protein
MTPKAPTQRAQHLPRRRLEMPHRNLSPEITMTASGGPAMTVPIVSLIAYGAIAVAALAALPVWPWSRNLGNANAGALAYILAVVSINAVITQTLGG